MSDRMWALNWCFCHNGQIPLFEDHPTHCLLGDDPSLSPSQQQQRYYYPVGETDSEMAFCAILNAIRNRFPDTMPSLPDLYSTIHSLCREIVEYNPQSTIMNFLLTCGPHVLWVYSWPGQRPGSAVWNGLHYLVLPSSSASSQKDTKDLCDGDISVRLQGRRHGNNGNNEDETDNMCFVATKPLTNDTEWIEMKAGELIVLDKGIPYVTARDLFHIELRGHGLDNSNKALQPPRLEEDMRRYQFDPSFYVGGGI